MSAEPHNVDGERTGPAHSEAGEARPTNLAPKTAGSAVTPDGRKRRPTYVPQPPRTNEATPDEWLLSYADMTTLLLTMFVALLLNASFEKVVPPSPRGGPAISEPDSGAGAGAGDGARRFLESVLKLQVVSPYAEGETYTISTDRNAAPVVAPEGAELAVVKATDLERIRQREEALAGLRYRLKQADLDTFVTTAVEGDGIRLNIPNSILFATGLAQLQEQGEIVISALAPIIAATARFTISVEGHTDDVPIKTDRFPSNWELSAQRAATVVRVLAETGVQGQRLEAVGHAESRPVASNATEEGRAQNRRVTLLLRLQP